MAKELDEIFYDALMGDADIKGACGYEAPEGRKPGKPARIYSTCVEVAPMDADNTPLPHIIITDEPMQDELGTKDEEWESDWDSVQAGVIIKCESPKEVKALRRKVRHAIAVYVANMDEGVPVLTAFSNDGIAWDWSRPCYFDTLYYQCDMYVVEEEEEETS